ncbi:hypothetical protein QOZ88_06050 [Blastococcus sp. BMG 814]|uniref:Roadblock/LAMTOR2 domain-containing protein n=1 Tax=Blastococcus carthaginiensis TaxID=3050034 RepID=A0ABT9I9E7_9ACTN|nr:hypothetical protein [Blastococcus carthaginiensis]MDP5182193.1 hypothetical protein [Blastococcus carthaginiensis]
MSIADTAPAITAEQLAALVLGRTTACVVQDATGTIHSVDYLDRVAVDDPDVVVLLTRDQAVALLQEQAAVATEAMRAAGVIL